MREKAMEWFLQKTEDEKIALKNKYFRRSPIQYTKLFGFAFTFGQIDDMYKKEN